MMKQTILTLACLLAMVAPSFAQNFAGNKIIGTYWVEQDGDKSKVRFSKTGANTYKAQINPRQPPRYGRSEPSYLS